LEDAADILSLIKTDDDVMEALYLRSFQAYILTGRGDAAQAAAMLPWMIEKGRESVGFLTGNALLAAAPAYVQLGETQNALTLLAECLETPATVLSNYELVPSVVRAALSVGEQQLATGLFTCITADSDARPPLVQHVVTSVRALIAEAHGEYAAAAEGFAGAAASWRTFEMPYEEGQALLGMGRCLARIGRRTEAAAALHGARGRFAELEARPALEETDSLLGTLPRA
jgi:tetratricopeptide (TPR) repeat protein